MTRFVSYLRVSRERQGRSGLGLEAQREAVSRYLESVGGDLAGEFIEVESGKRADRPELRLALDQARAMGAVFLVAKLDRLARDARFLLAVVDGSGEAGVTFCDLPQLPAGPVGRFLVTMLAAVAELEGGMISDRTKAALAVAKARGIRLGNPQLAAGSAEGARRALAVRRENARARADDVRPYIEAAIGAGAGSLAEIAAALTARGIKAPRGGSRWAPAQVARIIGTVEKVRRNE